jgi:hypothetical protein
MGYGGVRFLRSREVSDISNALDDLSFEDRLATFDERLATSRGIYCPNHPRDELRHWFEQLRSFYRHAATQGSALLLWIA